MIVVEMSLCGGVDGTTARPGEVFFACPDEILLHGLVACSLSPEQKRFVADWACLGRGVWAWDPGCRSSKVHLPGKRGRLGLLDNSLPDMDALLMTSRFCLSRERWKGEVLCHT